MLVTARTARSAMPVRSGSDWLPPVIAGRPTGAAGCAACEATASSAVRIRPVSTMPAAHAVGEVGRDGIGVDLVVEREGPGKGAVAAFHLVVVDVLGGPFHTLAANGELRICHGQLDLLAGHAG